MNKVCSIQAEGYSAHFKFISLNDVEEIELSVEFALRSEFGNFTIASKPDSYYRKELMLLAAYLESYIIKSEQEDQKESYMFLLYECLFSVRALGGDRERILLEVTVNLSDEPTLKPIFVGGFSSVSVRQVQAFIKDFRQILEES